MGETIEDIVQQERERQTALCGNVTILVDGSLHEQTGSWLWNTYEANDFNQLPLHVLQDVRQHHERFVALLRSEGVLTTSLVADELSTYETIVSGKLDFLLHASKPGLRVESRRTRKAQYGRDERDMPAGDCAEQRECYAAITLLARNIATLSRKRSFKPGDEKAYRALFTAVCEVIQRTKAKISYRSRYNDRTTTPTGLPADESQVAAALYLSVIDNKPSALISRDSDISRILYEMNRYLRAEHMPGKERMDAALSTNPIRSYFINSKGEIMVKMDTAHPGIDPVVAHECGQFKTGIVHFLRTRWPTGILNGAAQTAIR